MMVTRLVLPAPDKNLKTNIYFKIRQVSLEGGIYNSTDVLCYRG